MDNANQPDSSPTVTDCQVNSTSHSQEAYPEDLDPFKDEADAEAEESQDQLAELPSQSYPEHLDPFRDDSSGENDENNEPSSRISGSSLETSFKTRVSSDDYDASLNPFGDEDESSGEETGAGEEIKNESLSDSKVTDFQSNRELNNNSETLAAPIPAPRKSLSHRASASSFCDRSSYSTSSLERKSIDRRNASNSPVPLDRLSLGHVNSDLRHSVGNLSCISVQSSSTSSPARSHKKRRAPNPPGYESSNLNRSQLSANTSDAISVSSDLGYTPNQNSSNKDINREDNISPTVRSTDSDTSINNLDKNTFGYWRKRKKKQAPGIPIPKRNIVTIPLPEIQAESNLVGEKLSNVVRRISNLEKQLGEEIQRSKKKRLVVEYLQLAKEKCQLSKRQEELDCLKSQHELQQQQTEIEYQIRILDAKPISMKTELDDDKCKELVQGIVAIVQKRNDIEEEMIQINKRAEYEQLIERLKQIKVDENMDVLVNECMKKNKAKEERAKKEHGFEHTLKSKIGKISTLKKHIAKQI